MTASPLAFSLSWLSCERCDLAPDRSNVVLGRGNPNAEVMFFGEGPGPDEDLLGHPFIGKSGKLLDDFIRRIGWRREDLFIDNIVSCFVGSTTVEAPGVQIGYRRHYSGDILRVVTSFDEFTGTPNHPVLTSSGWKPLRDLLEGDSIVRCCLGEGVCSRDPDIKHGPVEIQELVRSLSENGTLHRIVERYVDFHGDGGNSEIEVVAINSLLTNILRAMCIKHLSKNIFEAANHLPGLLKLLGPRYRSVVELLWRHPQLTACCASSFGPLTPTFWRDNIVSPEKGLRPITDSDVVVEQIPAKSWWTNMGRPSQGFESFPGKVSLDKVIKIDVGSLDGHVFNLGTRPGWYTANGYVVSNCFPHNEVDGNAVIRAPNSKEIAACRSRVLETIYRVDPILIITLGATAVKGLTGITDSMTNARGGLFSVRVPGFYKYVTYPVFAMYHPAYLLRNPRQGPGTVTAEFWEDLKFARKLVDLLKKFYEGRGEW